MKKYLVIILAVMFTMVSCDEDPAPSLITKAPKFTFTDAPMMIMTSDVSTTTFPVTFKLSSEQVMEVTVEVYVEEENSTAVEGEPFTFSESSGFDFTISPKVITIPGYLNEGTFNITVIGDEFADDDMETAKIKLRAVPSQGNPQDADIEASTFGIDFMIADYDEATTVNLVCDWDGLVGVPSANGGDPSLVFGLCGNGVDLDPYFLADSGNVFGNYSDDYGACPEQFSSVDEWPDDYYIFECENFSNIFGNFPDAIGDLCMTSWGLRVGTATVEIPQTDCFALTELGYADAGGSYRTTSLFNMFKSGNTFQFFTPSESLVGEFRYSMSAEHQAIIDAKKAAHEGQPTSTELTIE